MCSFKGVKLYVSPDMAFVSDAAIMIFRFHVFHVIVVMYTRL